MHRAYKWREIKMIDGLSRWLQKSDAFVEGLCDANNVSAASAYLTASKGSAVPFSRSAIVINFLDIYLRRNADTSALRIFFPPHIREILNPIIDFLLFYFVPIETRRK